MKLITLDFETYYDKKCSIKKLGTSLYVQHPDFEVNSLSWHTPGMDKPEFIGGPVAVAEFFERLKPCADEIALCCHHTQFDGYVASFVYDFIPAFYFCTMSMAKPIWGQYGSTSLQTVSKHYGLRGKVQGVLEGWEGLRWDDATPEQQAELGLYNNDDVEMTVELFNRLKVGFPVDELKIIDMTIRMFTRPLIEIDANGAQQIIDKEKQTKDEALRAIFPGKDLEQCRTIVRSNPQFADVLRTLGVEPPSKISPTTGEPTYAFAKSDLPFQALQNHEDWRVRALMAARLANKTSINETRAKKMIQKATHPLPIYLGYCGAHTFRFTGGDQFNPQNLPRDGRLRACLTAPKGHTFVVIDASQIEARDNAVFSEQWDLVDEFAAGVDVYSSFASDLYGFEVNAQDHGKERFVGKTCLAADTKVLTKRGWVDIVDVQITDQLWDGVEWVNHQGVLCAGRKPTIKLSGVEMTPDHGILVDGSDQWMDAQDVLENPTAFQSALDSVVLPSLDSAHGRTTSTTKEESKNSNLVYDLLNAGKRTRFTILSNSGPLIVHNSILGLGYQCGASKFQAMLETGAMGPALELKMSEAERIVQMYRAKYYKIKDTWSQLQSLIQYMMPDSPHEVEFRGIVFQPGGKMLMPNGLTMHYPNLGMEVGEYGTAEFTYYPYHPRYRKPVAKKLYGGSSLENIIQSRCRTITTHHALEMSRFYPVVLLVHDEIVMCVPNHKAERCLRDATEIMATPPDWNPKIPLASEGKITERYTK